MPEEKIFYHCPVCDSAFETEMEAEDCRDDHGATQEHVWLCSGCHEEFSTVKEALEHETFCRYAPPSCTGCAHCDGDFMRHNPCPRYNFDLNMKSCEHFERAVR
mgnify:CR=1 FL=1